LSPPGWVVTAVAISKSVLGFVESPINNGRTIYNAHLNYLKKMFKLFKIRDVLSLSFPKQ